ncbi:MAG: hypothetical protein NTY75_02405, partial [Candidatus Shapirobacteria bacterium]|nr:hypothetical protein [Candidatus Shapirobacteria bacterium]
MINEGIRWGRKFGYGTFLGNKGEKYFQEDIEKRVRKMAWSHACPVVEKVVKEYGPEWTEKRYAECNLFFGLITDEAAGCNFPLYFNLLQPVDRLPEETADPNINKKNVPLTFWRQMSPLSTPWGYALPRVLIEQFGRGENNKDRTAERITKGLQILEDEVRID